MLPWPDYFTPLKHPPGFLSLSNNREHRVTSAADLCVIQINTVQEMGKSVSGSISWSFKVIITVWNIMDAIEFLLGRVKVAKSIFAYIT